MVKLLEPELELMVRESEVGLVEDMIGECEEDFTNLMREETQDEYECKLSVIQDRFLNNSNGALCGGVVLYAHKRRIVCSNTLEDRLNLIFEQELPTLRNGLFPKEQN